MWNNDPFQKWLVYAEARDQFGATVPAYEISDVLRQLEALLEANHNAKPNYGAIRVYRYVGEQNTVASPEDVDLAQKLYLQVWERGGQGYASVLEQLINIIAMAIQAVSIPFWQSLLDLKKPRDHTRQQRINSAVAALMLLAYHQGNQDAWDALVEALSHPEALVRVAVIMHVVELYEFAEVQPSTEMLEAIRNCASSGKDYEPRYQARLALWVFEQPLPLDNPGGVYVLNVHLQRDPSPRMRRLALRSEQTLSDLHHAIQQAFEWDADHLYSFYMNGRSYDRDYEIGLPDDDFAFGDWGFLFDDADDMDDDDNDETVLAEEELDADEADEGGLADADEWSVFTVRLGDLALLRKHKFLYLFDFGDNHEFEITVEAIEPQADAGDYPRLLEAVGDSPPQYDYPDEDGWDDADDDIDRDSQPVHPRLT